MILSKYKQDSVVFDVILIDLIPLAGLHWFNLAIIALDLNGLLAVIDKNISGLDFNYCYLAL